MAASSDTAANLTLSASLMSGFRIKVIPVHHLSSESSQKVKRQDVAKR